MASEHGRHTGVGDERDTDEESKGRGRREEALSVVEDAAAGWQA